MFIATVEEQTGHQIDADELEEEVALAEIEGEIRGNFQDQELTKVKVHDMILSEVGAMPEDPANVV